MSSDPALPWRTSSYSGDANGNCVEVAVLPGMAHVRDTKDRSGGIHRYPRATWAAFLSALRD